MARRTVLNVIERVISPTLHPRMMVGVTHRPFLKSVPAALLELRIEDALVLQAIEGSDESPLDGVSALVRIRGGEIEEFNVSPDSLGLPRVTRSHITRKGAEYETRQVLAELEGEEGPVRAVILYNAALRLSLTDETASLVELVERADEALRSSAALELLDGLRRPALVGYEETLRPARV